MNPTLWLHFFLRLYFSLNSVRFTATLRGKYGDFPFTPHSHPCTASPISLSHTRWYICANDDPTRTHYYNRESIIYIRFPSWYSTYHGFEQMHSIMASLLLCTQKTCKPKHMKFISQDSH